MTISSCNEDGGGTGEGGSSAGGAGTDGRGGGPGVGALSHVLGKGQIHTKRHSAEDPAKLVVAHDMATAAAAAAATVAVTSMPKAPSYSANMAVSKALQEGE